MSRSFLRVRIGERTFCTLTVISLMFFIWGSILLIDLYNDFFTRFTSNELERTGNAELSWLVNLSAGLLAFGAALLQTMYHILSGDLILSNINIPAFSTSSIVLFAIILFVSIGHFIDIYTRKRRKEIIHSYYRGDSFFFGWLVNRKIGDIKITQLGVWLIVEPISIFLLAVIVENVFGYHHIAVLLKISSICLFIEEYRVYHENRQFILELIDNQLDSAFVAELQKQYSESLEQAKASTFSKGTTKNKATISN